LAIGGMELSWLYAWATFLTTSIVNQAFPVWEATGTFILASFITLFSTGKGWRVISILGVQVLGFILAALRNVYVFHSWSAPFWGRTWLAEFFSASRSPLEWLHLILLFLITLMLWVGGVTLARRKVAYSALCARFDLGLAAFCALFLIKLLFWAKGGIKLEESISLRLVFPFFVFSLLAIGLVRNQPTTAKNFLPGFQGIGVILSFVVVVFLLGTGLVLFFLPYLTLSAEAGYVVLKTVAKPIGYIFVAVIRFLYMPRIDRPETPSRPPRADLEDSTGPADGGGWWTEQMEKILGWVLGGFTGLFTLFAFGAVVYLIGRWLFSRSPLRPRRQGPWDLISLWAESLRMFLFAGWRSVVRGLKGYERAVQIYTALLQWGRHSGLPRFLSETPREYGTRLENRFPRVRREIDSIIEAFNREVYGEMALKQQELESARHGWRRLRSPLLWPPRLKTWLLKKEN
jgi:hypothetical protein